MRAAASSGPMTGSSAGSTSKSSSTSGSTGSPGRAIGAHPVAPDWVSSTRLTRPGRRSSRPRARRPRPAPRRRDGPRSGGRHVDSRSAAGVGLATTSAASTGLRRSDPRRRASATSACVLDGPRRSRRRRLDHHDLAGVARDPAQRRGEVVARTDDARGEAERHGERGAVQQAARGSPGRLPAPVELGLDQLGVVGYDDQAAVAQQAAARGVLDVVRPRSTAGRARCGRAGSGRPARRRRAAACGRRRARRASSRPSSPITTAKAQSSAAPVWVARAR